MSQDTQKRTKKPGARLITLGTVAFVYGLVILLINLLGPVETPDKGAAGAVIVMLCGAGLVAFGRRKQRR